MQLRFIHNNETVEIREVNSIEDKGVPKNGQTIEINGKNYKIYKVQLFGAVVVYKMEETQ